jgi:hypothetical protein
MTRVNRSSTGFLQHRGSPTAAGKIGLHVTQNAVPTGPWFAALRGGDFRVSTGGSCHGIVNPVLDVQSWLPRSVSESNYGYYEDPKELDIYEKMLHETDLAKQRAPMFQYNEAVWKQAPGELDQFGLLPGIRHRAGYARGARAEIWLRNDAQSICANASFSSSIGALAVGCCGPGTRGGAGVPGRAGNCSVHGSVGKGQPGHPVLGALAVATGGCEIGTLGTAGSSFFVERVSFQALARLSASAR